MCPDPPFLGCLFSTPDLTHAFSLLLCTADAFEWARVSEKPRGGFLLTSNGRHETTVDSDSVFHFDEFVHPGMCLLGSIDSTYICYKGWL